VGGGRNRDKNLIFQYSLLCATSRPRNEEKKGERSKEIAVCNTVKYLGQEKRKKEEGDREFLCLLAIWAQGRKKEKKGIQRGG